MRRKFKLIIFFLFTFININNFSYADNSIYFIDLDYIYKNSIAGKKINDQIKKESNKINDQLQNYKKKMKKEQI